MFFIVFFVYPSICSISFSAFNHIKISSHMEVLHDDDRVFVDSANSSDGVAIVIGLSYVVTVIVAFGVPLMVLAYLLRKIGKYASSAESGYDRSAAHHIAEDLSVTENQAAYVIRDVTVGKEFSFLMDAYRPEYFYWEVLDMLRKVALVGVVGLGEKGSASQIVLASVLSFGFFAAHVKLWPYPLR
eukprot:COSAG05_NODE_4124_length_1662_cov_1.570697_2_plen_186_part_00